MTPEEEQSRGHQAKRVLSDKIYIEAHTAVRDKIIAELSKADTTGEKRERLNSLLVALSTVNRYMEQVMVGGKMAAEQIERDRTLRERIMQRVA